MKLQAATRLQATEVTALTREQFDKWDKRRQAEYLKEHPNSSFAKKKKSQVQRTGLEHYDRQERKAHAKPMKDSWRHVKPQDGPLAKKMMLEHFPGKEDVSVGEYMGALDKSISELQQKLKSTPTTDPAYIGLDNRLQGLVRIRNSVRYSVGL